MKKKLVRWLITKLLPGYHLSQNRVRKKQGEDGNGIKNQRKKPGNVTGNSANSTGYKANV